MAQSGFSFGLQIPVSAVITSVAQKKVTSLSDFETALAGVPNKARERGVVGGKKQLEGGEIGGFFASKTCDFTDFNGLEGFFGWKNGDFEWIWEIH